MTVIHRFQQGLDNSIQDFDRPVWKSITSHFFPDGVEFISDRQLQNHYDFIGKRKDASGAMKTFYAEYKTRHATGKIFTDILLETISNDVTGALGWTLKLEMPPGYKPDGSSCYIVMYLNLMDPNNQVLHVMPAQALRKVFEANKDKWAAKYKERPAQNETYKTWNIGVPVQELNKKIREYGEQIGVKSEICSFRVTDKIQPI